MIHGQRTAKQNCRDEIGKSAEENHRGRMEPGEINEHGDGRFLLQGHGSKGVSYDNNWPAGGGVNASSATW